MNERKNYYQWIWGIHLLFWLVLTILLFMIFRGILATQDQVVLATVVNLTGFLLLVYGHLLFLLPRYFDQGRYKKYFLGLLIWLTLTSVFRFFVGWGLVIEMNMGIEDAFTPSYFSGMFLGGVFLLFMTIPLRLIDNWFKKNELEKELKTHQLEAELRFLKAQVNPHFLFNTLNNIYSLSFNESKKTPEMILKLSDMMSYMLYDCKSEQVKLADEIQYLKNYIDLQQLKKDGEFNIDFEVCGDFSNVMITPMLFIPFFENAFKHGNLEDTIKGWLRSTLSVQDSRIQFSMSNSLNGIKKEKGKGGVGLENVRARLNLLYAEQHQLTINKYEDQFSVALTINLINQ